MERDKNNSMLVEQIVGMIDRRSIQPNKESGWQRKEKEWLNEECDRYGLPKATLKPQGNIAVIGSDPQRVFEVIFDVLQDCNKLSIRGKGMPESAAIPLVASPIDMDLVPDEAPVMSIMIQSLERLLTSVLENPSCRGDMRHGDHRDELHLLESSWFSLQRSSANYQRTTEESLAQKGEAGVVALAEQAQASIDMPSRMQELSERLSRSWIKVHRASAKEAVFVIAINAAMGLSSSPKRMAQLTKAMKALSDRRVIFILGVNKAFAPRHPSESFAPRHPSDVFDAYEFNVAFPERVYV